MVIKNVIIIIVIIIITIIIMKDEVHGFWIKHMTSLHTRIA